MIWRQTMVSVLITNYINRSYIRSGGVALLSILIVLHSSDLGAQTSSQFQTCATEGERCVFEGTREVYFGADKRWKKQVHTGEVDCKVSVFGDPAPDTPKSCTVRTTALSQISVTNGSADEIGVFFIAPSGDQTFLRVLDAGKTFVQLLYPKQQLAFAQNKAWLGSMFVAGTATEQAITVPYEATQGAKAATKVISESDDSRSEVNVSIENTTKAQVEVYYLDTTNEPSHLRSLATGEHYVQRLHPMQKLAFARKSNWVGDAFVAGTEANQSVSVPFSAPTDRAYAARGKLCAKQGGRCDFTGLRDVYFGAGNRWVVRRANGGSDCTIDAFGDPAPNVSKNCYYAAKNEVSVMMKNRSDLTLLAVLLGTNGEDPVSLATLDPGMSYFAVIEAGRKLAFANSRNSLALGANYTASPDAPASIDLPYIPTTEQQTALAPVTVTLNNRAKENIRVYHYVDPAEQSLLLRNLAPGQQFTHTMYPSQRLATQQGKAWSGDFFVAGIEAKQSINLPFSAPADHPYIPRGVKCADEGKRCKFKGPREVYFGVANRWKIKRAISGVDCTTRKFGDPAPGAPKQCYLAPENEITVTLRNTSKADVLVFEYDKKVEEETTVKEGEKDHEPTTIGTVAPGKTRFVIIKKEHTLGFSQNDEYFGAEFKAILGAPAIIQLPYIEKLSQKRVKELAAKVLEELVKKQTEAVNSAPACWKNSYGRGVGTIPQSCGSGQARAGVLCYGNCKAGFRATAGVCWQDCPTGSSDQGAFCRFNEYGRGAGYAAWDFGLCESQNGGSGSCEWSGPMAYPKCKSGYEPFGCCICRPSKVVCKDPTGGDMLGQFDLSCTRKSYVNPPKVGQCAAGETMDAGGLCYTSCPKTHDPIGPVCWEQCPSSHPVVCGAACARTDADCGAVLSEQISSPLITAGGIAITAASLGTATPGVIAAKAAASTGKLGGKIAIKAAARLAAKKALKDQVRRSLRSSLIKGAKSIASDLTLDATIGAVITSAIYVGKGVHGIEVRKQYNKAIRKELDNKLSQTIDEASVDTIIETAMTGAEKRNPAADFPWESLDPVGIAEIVVAFKLPMCSDVK